jgi:hypothetical protein
MEAIMADAKELKSGLLLNFDGELWFVPLAGSSLEDKIAEIKQVLVGEEGGKGGALAGARRLKDADQHAISGLQTEEIRELLSRGITIRPMGR